MIDRDACANDNTAPVENIFSYPLDFVWTPPPKPAPPADPLRSLIVRIVANDDPPFDPPDLDDAFVALEDDEAPFDPPDAADLQPLSLTDNAEDTDEPRELLLTAPAAPPSIGQPRRAPQAGDDQPLPAIKLHLCWDRPAMADLFADLVTDERVSRAETTLHRGGLDSAVLRYADGDIPDLIVLDTTLRAPQIVAALNQLAHVLEQGAKVIVLGAVNDVGLLRELAGRGVSEYIMAPFHPDDLVAAMCRLYADTDKSRVVAVIGARGGVGASTVAHNLAWSIAEQQEARTTLVDFDLSFGTAALNFDRYTSEAVADALLAPNPNDSAFLERVAAKATDRLTMLAPPAMLGHPFELDVGAVDAVIKGARRMSAFVILDLPHTWNTWVKQTLIDADDVIIVATPDLASLRNAKALLDQLNPARPGAEAVVALSMIGAPKRPEISFKDFAGGIGATPVLALGFDTALFTAAEIKGRMIGEIAPTSKPAKAFDDLAAALTGRDAPTRKSFTVRLEPEAQTPPADIAYLADMRRAAHAWLEPAPAKKKQGSSFGRIAATAIGLFAPVLIGGWLINQSEAATPRVAHRVAVAPVETPQSLYVAALQLIASGNPQAAAAQLRISADHGYAPAQYRLAHLYEHGEGVSADLAIARQLTERAATGGNVSAMHDLGVFLARGEGGGADEPAAFRWFHQAAEYGVRDSQYNLGLFYAQGRGGVEADPEEALFWFSLAAAQGDNAAADRALAIEPELLPAQIERTNDRARDFRPRTPIAAANPS